MLRAVIGMRISGDLGFLHNADGKLSIDDARLLITWLLADNFDSSIGFLDR